MPSLKDFASQYADYLKLHFSSPTVITDIAKKIRSLTYTESGEPLSDSDIETLINEIESILTQTREYPGGVLLKEAEDSTMFIQMVKMIREEIKKR